MEETDHECTVECGFPRCYRSADYTFCDKHYEEELDSVRDEERDRLVDIVNERMKDWEWVVNVDNPVTIEDIKKELVERMTANR